jgi:glutamyl endopeptidase
VVTAGHCVFLHRHGGWAQTIEVVPGADGNQRPYGASIATSFRSVTGWTRRRRQATNYGAIILPADNALGNLLGHFGFNCLSDHELFGLKLSLAGYPSDRAHATQWYQQRLIEAVTARGLSYQSGTPGGPSGAPLWHVRDGQRYVVAIYTHGDGHGPAATRITPPVFQNLSAWQREGD